MHNEYYCTYANNIGLDVMIVTYTLYTNLFILVVSSNMLTELMGHFFLNNF